MDNNLMTGGGGVVLTVLGSILVASGTGPFVLGLLLLLVGVGLIVRLLLQMTEGSVGRAAAAGGGSGGGTGAGRGGLFDLSGIKAMPAMSRWVAGTCMGVLSLIGLFLYSRATDGMFGLFGGLLFLFGLAVIIVFVHQATDYSGEAHAHDEDEDRPDQGQAAA